MEKLFDAFKNYITCVKRNEKAYRPSGKEYDSQKLQDIQKELPPKTLDNSQEEIKVVNFLKISDLFHSYCVQFFDFLRAKLNSMNMRGEDIVEIFIAALNREYKVVTTKILAAQKQRSEKGKYLFQDMTNPRIIMPGGYAIDVKAGLEGVTDGVNQICNIIRIFRKDEFKDETAKPEEFASHVIHMFMEGDKFETFKYSYDDILYNGGYVKYDPGADAYTFDYDSHRKLKLLKAGHMIMQERIHKYYQGNQIHPTKSPFDKYVANYRVKQVKMEAGYVKVEFEQGDPRDHREVASEMKAAMDAYYKFLDLYLELKGDETLTLIEVIAVWSALRYICMEVLEKVNCDQEMYTKEDMEAIPRRFKVADLVEYVSTLTGIEPHRAKAALEKFEVSWSTFNDIWTAPLYKVGDYYSIPFYPVMNCVHYNIIEKILEKGGHKLEKRGPVFEKYLFDEIANFPLHRYYVKCLDSRLYGTKRNGEQIDLIVALRDMIILVEAKCIHYSMAPYNYADNWQQLVKGAKQAKKKTAFMQQHPELFAELGDIRGKKILPVVVTNYPVFSGFEYEGIYVTDAHSFVSYINVGNITVTAFTKDSMKLVKEAWFYTNEAEYASKFEDYLKENPVKKFYIDKMTIEDIPLISLEKPWRFKTRTAVYHGHPGFNITNIIPAN